MRIFWTPSEGAAPHRCNRWWIGLLILVSIVPGCGRSLVSAGSGPPVRPPAGRSHYPGLGPAREIEPGVLWYDAPLPSAGGASRLWIYLPRRRPGEKLPCVLIAPAGSRMFHGMALGDSDRAEQLPYVRAGMAVVAYAIDGDLSPHPSGRELVAATRQFMAADAGLVNAREALDYALTKVPGIDAGRIYTAGHSSAATLSLLVAENDPRIRACVAYAPVCDVPRHLGERATAQLELYVPGVGAFLQRRSPLTDVQRLRCPLFMFHADDDSVVPTREVSDFVAALRQTHGRVTFARAQSGGHYESMIRQGVPLAIRWLKHLPPR